MKTLLAVLISLLTLSSFAQSSETVNLRWKIGKDEKLTYATVMNDIDTSTLEMNFNGLFKALLDSSKSGLAESKDFFKKLNQSIKNQGYITTLSNKGNGVIDIIMTTKPKETTKDTKKDTSESKEAEFMKMMQEMSQGVMLRGSVYETGGVQSFWLKSSQKNIIALFFELPSKPVKVGDKWPLDVNLIANDQSFACDSSYKINEVTLTDIKKVNGETIAVLKYNIVEYVKGMYNSPAIFGNDDGQKESMMKFTHEGIAEFSVDKGRWISYDGIMSLESTGLMSGNKKTKFTLINSGN